MRRARRAILRFKRQPAARTRNPLRSRARAREAWRKVARDSGTRVRTPRRMAERRAADAAKRIAGTPSRRRAARRGELSRAMTTGVCRSGTCENARGAKPVELYPGPGEFCPSVRRSARARCRQPAPFGGLSALEALTQFDPGDPPARAPGTRTALAGAQAHRARRRIGRRRRGRRLRGAAAHRRAPIDRFDYRARVQLQHDRTLCSGHRARVRDENRGPALAVRAHGTARCVTCGSRHGASPATPRSGATGSSSSTRSSVGTRPSGAAEPTAGAAAKLAAYAKSDDAQAIALHDGFVAHQDI